MKEDFTNVRFGLHDLSTLGLTVVSSSNYYDQNLLPAPSDTTLDVPGGDGQYYFGQYYKNREFKVNVAFDNVSEQQWRKMSQIFATDKLQDLVFNQNPYKTYKAKVKSKPEFKYVCFRDAITGERIYKGTGTLTFVAYHPYAYCYNKYVVRAADFYKCTQPQDIITNSIEDNPYSKREKPSMLPGLIKDHYNVKPNMGTPWKGGYPSIEQVQWGELYFKLNNHENDYQMNCEKEESKYVDTHLYYPAPAGETEYQTDRDNNNLGIIVDVRHYWDNIPQWESTAKLLTTPTLDYEQNLIYMPQYSTTNYYNMETGLNQQNALIGCRLLVYNPGDIEIPFELKLSNLQSDKFDHFRKLTGTQKFRISRYNVQRLSTEQAVDWTGLRTQDRDDEEDFKYGTRYVFIIEPGEGANQDNPTEPIFRHLKAAHPNYLYIAEPIPRDKLGHFIRLFYWQSRQAGAKWLDWEEGKELANRYEELLDQCITEDEKNELYWDTLINHVLILYKKLDEELNNNKKFFSTNYTWEDFVYDFIYNPPEYYRNIQKPILNNNTSYEELDYGEFEFNLAHLPQYYTYDFLEITNDNFENLFEDNYNTEDYTDEEQRNLILDFDSRMMYNIKENNEDDVNYGMNKVYYTENIVKGKWFLLPPGWSLIDIAPVVDETLWGGKRWLDARPFNWGTNSNKDRAKFDKYERLAIIDYISQKSPLCNLQRTDVFDHIGENLFPGNNYSAIGIKNQLSSYSLETLEDFIQFRRWYENDSSYANYKDWPTKTVSRNIQDFGYELWRNRIEQAEYRFLKTLADYWRVNHLNKNGVPNSENDVNEWWWNANNYSWHNFPPLYWAYADFLNKAEIKYIPQYY